MSGPRRLLHTLLAGLVVLVGLPRMEQRHAHANGGDPHHHHEVEAPQGADPHEHHEARPGDPDQDATPDQDGVEPPSWTSALEWHTHQSWGGGLIGADWRPAGEGDPATVEADPSTGICDARTPTNLSSWLEALALLRCVHGPPGWPRIAAPRASRLAQTTSEGGAVPPLCDRARHERSGVQRI